MEWDYAPAPESRDIVSLRASYGLFIDGAFVDPTDGSSFKTVNPATEEALAEVATAGPGDVARAVAAARRAHTEVWGPMPAAERAKYLYRIARVIQERARELAVLETLDNGKPIRESRDVDIPLAAGHFFHYAGWADKLEHAGLGPSPRAIGVAGQIIPWNFPLLMAAWKLAPALAAGNTCVLKPAETTPLSALLLAEILQDVDLPPGVVNILSGDGATGAALVAHPDVGKVAFTGSTGVGKEIQRVVAGTPKRLTLELGGKAANVVFDDAPVDQAIEGIVNGIFFNQGHVCCAGSRLLVQESVVDVVLDALKRRLSTLRLGDPLDKNTDIGAINSAEQLGRIRELVEAGDAEGARRWQSDCALPERGWWFPPTVFTGVSQSHRVAREEIFGPVLSVLTFRTPEEAVAKANNTPYGLSAGVWTEKGSRILWMAQRLRAGVVWANTFNRFDPASPFGGYKESGFGREGGRQGLQAYLEDDSRGGIDATVAPRRPSRASVAENDGGARDQSGRVEVRKTAKLFIGGDFPRSESGRSYRVTTTDEVFLGNVALASRKDARDAVRAARSAFAGWSARDALNRGQILYRIAELTEARHAELADLVAAAEGIDLPAARQLVHDTIDRWVWYAGWTDKLAQVLGSANPVSGPYFNFSIPEPMGVVAVLAPQDSSLLGLVSALAPVLATGNTAVMVASELRPLPAVSLAEIASTADVPAGVMNLLTGRVAELAPVLASHEDLDAIDLTGAPAELATELAVAAADTVTRTFALGGDWGVAPSLARLRAVLETKTVWHPQGI